MKVPAPTKSKVGRVGYVVVVRDPVAYPTLEFARKKDAECYLRMLTKSRTLMDFKVEADILRQEVTKQGYHL